MSDLHVRNFWRHQHYRDRNPPWIKLYGDLLVDEEVRDLTPTTRLTAILLLLVAARRGNRIPNRPSWLAEEIGLAPGAVKRAISDLLDVRYLVTDEAEVVPRDASEPASTPASKSASEHARPHARTRADAQGRTRARGRDVSLSSSRSGTSGPLAPVAPVPSYHDLAPELRAAIPQDILEHYLANDPTCTVRDGRIYLDGLLLGPPIPEST